ncbi:MAG: GumC family protein [Candidatus Sulfotelmatobacter sp.]
MTDQALTQANEEPGSAFTLRDLLAIGFRHQRLAARCFFGIMAGAILTAILTPAQYRTTTKFLVERERMDPIVSPEQNTSIMLRGDVTEEEINSEIGLLQGSDVLRQVVVSCGLDKRKRLLSPVFGGGDPDRNLEQAAASLAKNLQIELVKKSNLIEVSYTSTDPQLAARVLRALGETYIQRHVAVHTPPGQVQFFEQETEHYKKNLGDAEVELEQFSQQQDGVAPQVVRDITLQKLSEFRSSLQQTRAAIADTRERIQTLEKQVGTTPERLTTSMRQSDDAQVLQGLKNTLIGLELKRTELLTKYQSTYPLVQEIDKQIADTRSSIATEESNPLKEETTDRNPTYAWINEELARAKAEYSGLQARAAATQAIVANYERRTRDLEEKGIIEQDLQRTLKTNEESYLLYLRKREQARMTQALDATRIVNVAIAEQPIVPSIPSSSPWLTLLLGASLATAVTLGVVSIREYLDASFRTPAEVASELNIPVLAAVPNTFDGLHTNGNGSRNGHGRNGGRSASDPSGSVVPPTIGERVF